MYVCVCVSAVSMYMLSMHAAAPHWEVQPRVCEGMWHMAAADVGAAYVLCSCLHLDPLSFPGQAYWQVTQHLN